MEPLTAGVGFPCQPRGGCHEDRAEDESLSHEAQAGVSPGLKVAWACWLTLLRWGRQWPPLRMGPATRPRTRGPHVEPCGPGPRSPAFHQPLHLALRTSQGTQPVPDCRTLSVWVWPVTCQGHSQAHGASILRAWVQEPSVPPPRLFNTSGD